MVGAKVSAASIPATDHSTKCHTQNGPFQSTAVQILGAVVDNIQELSEEDGVDQLLAAMPLPE